MRRFMPAWMAGVFILIVSSYFLLFVRVDCRSVERREVDLGRPYPAALMRLGKKENLERMLAANGGELVEKTWDRFDFRIDDPPFLSTWSLSADGRFKVKTSGSQVAGEVEVTQSVRAKRGSANVKSQMSCPRGHVRMHNTEITVAGGKSSVAEVSNEVHYERVVPFWMRDRVKEMLEDYNVSYVDNMCSCLKSIMLD